MCFNIRDAAQRMQQMHSIRGAGRAGYPNNKPAACGHLKRAGGFKRGGQFAAVVHLGDDIGAADKFARDK